MKKLIFTLLGLCTIQMVLAQTTYYWVGGATPSVTSFNTSSLWNTTPGGGGTARTTAMATDILIIDGTDISDAVGAQTGAIVFSFTSPTANTGPSQLKITGGADVTFKRSGTSGTTTLTIGTGNAVDNDPDFVVAAGSKFTIAGTGGSLLVVVDANATAEFSGDVAITEGNSTQQNRFTSKAAGNIRFLAGSTFTTATAYAYYPFSTTGSSNLPSTNGVVFESGSSYYFNGGLSPFGSNSTSFLTVFKPGSKFYFRAANAANMFTNRSYADVVIENNATVTADGSLIRIDSLRIETGATFITHTTGVTPVHGHIVNNGTLRVPAANPDRDNKIILAGSTQNISGTGTYTLADIVISNATAAVLQKNLQVDSIVRIIGSFNPSGFSITGGGTVSAKTAASVNVTGNTNVDSFLVKNISDFTGIEVGMSVSGTGVPANTVVINTSSTTGTITLSKPVTGSSTYAGAAVNMTIFNAAGQLLPVKLSMFGASLVEEKVNLKWSVVTEENMAYYAVERSTDGSNFKQIGAVKAERMSYYYFTDISPVAGANYYRLKMVDTDGSYSYSSVVKLNTRNRRSEIITSPNPVIGRSFILMANDLKEGNYTITVVGSTGQRIMEKNLGRITKSITTNIELPGNITKGVYTIILSGNNERITHRILVQ